MPADSIIHNASIVSLDTAYPNVSAIAIEKGRIASVGNDDVVAAFRGRKTKLIDCRGKTVVPGFHDAHCHPVGLAENLLSVDVNPDRMHSISDIIATIQRVSLSVPSGRWIRAGRYSEFYLDEKRHPTRWDLDRATSIHPIKLSHRSGHAHVLNSHALAIAGISVETPDPPGGIIDRNVETGEPNGILYNMGNYLAKVIPALSDDDLDAGVKLANEKLLSFGITSFQDASDRNDINRWKLYQRWKDGGLLKSRVTMMLGWREFEGNDEQNFTPTVGDEKLHIGAVKIVLGETTGSLYPPLDDLKEKVLAIHQAGFQVALHAVEPIEVDAACQSIEHAVCLLPRSNHRHRIEHCSVCEPAIVQRVAGLSALIVTQPPFVYYNGDRYLETVSERDIDHLYPLARLLQAGLVVAASSDCPVVSPDPLMGIYGAVSRLTTSRRSIVLEERISALDALRMYTSYAACSNFSEEFLGTITPGKYADFVVLSADPTTVDTEGLRNIKTEMTIVDGEIVWERNVQR